jgi:hypothetical protein
MRSCSSRVPGVSRPLRTSAVKDGEVTCVRGEMGLSKSMHDALSDPHRSGR